MRTTALALASAILIAAAVPAHATEDHATIARNLAENVLGKGMVRTSRMANGERAVVMVWESATYKPANSLARTRDMLRVEVHLVTEGIFRVLTSVQDVQFEIVLGKRSLATGAARRVQPMTITYARDLGG
ncbi:MAG: hypothetical protein FJX73_03730 [Armatimonadetes bacterium]|nr:hypothetical protein [Armatimonadota bacterium]